MNSIELIEEAIKFQNAKAHPTRKRIGDWLHGLDAEGLVDLQEQLTEVMYENSGDDYVLGALMNLREYVEAELGTRTTTIIGSWLKKKLNIVEK